MDNIFSPNMLKTYESCPKKFYYQYVEKLSLPKTDDPFEKGKKIHALANYYLKNIKIDRIQNALTQEEQTLWQKLVNNKYYNYNCYKSEFQLNIKLKNHWIGGRIDAIVYNQNDYYILDYKTGTIPKNPQNDYQTMIYLLCIDNYLKNYESLSFVYLDLKNDRNFKIDYSNTIKTLYEQKIINQCEKIINDTKYPCNMIDCKFCEYKKICIE